MCKAKVAGSFCEDHLRSSMDQMRLDWRTQLSGLKAITVQKTFANDCFYLKRSEATHERSEWVASVAILYTFSMSVLPLKSA